MSQYASKFIWLSRFALDIITIENKKAPKFLKGIRANIFDQMAMMRSNTYVKALEHTQLAGELPGACYWYIHCHSTTLIE